MKKCIHFESCSAPICPDDEASLEKGLWYSDEEICRKRGVEWINRQAKIKHSGISNDSYFTYKMLSQNFRISSAVKGIASSDSRKEEVDIKQWLKDHRIKPLSPEEKLERIARLKKGRHTGELDSKTRLL